MVRLVFRPYTQVWRSICTSESLQTSTRVSSGFILPRHSSPSFGYQRVRSNSAISPIKEAGGLLLQLPKQPRSVTFIAPLGPIQDRATCVHVRLLGPCFKTGRVETDLLAPQFAQSHHASDNITPQPERVSAPESTKITPKPHCNATTDAHDLYWQHSNRSTCTDQHARRRQMVPSL